MVWDLEIAGFGIPCSGVVCLSADTASGEYHLLVHGPHFPDVARNCLADCFPVTLVAGRCEKQRRPQAGRAKVTSLREEEFGYILRLLVRLDAV